MTLRQRRDLSSFLNRKTSRAITTLQVLESIHGDSACACRKLQESAFLFSIPGANDLPEILNYLILLLVAPVVGVLLPIIHVDIRNATDKQFEFPLIENVDQVCRDELIEARDESVELLFDSLLDFPLCHQPAEVSTTHTRKLWHLLDIFLLVLVRDLNVAAARFEVNGLGFAELLVVNRKRLIENIGDIILQCPCQVLVIFFVYAFHVLDVDLLAKHHLVECTNEE